MKKTILISIQFILGTSILGNIGYADEPQIPSDLNLPQLCLPTHPHEDFGPVHIEQNDERSVRVTGLYYTEGGPLILVYEGTYPNGQMVFALEDEGPFPPRVKLLVNGGKTVFYGGTWGYSVLCEVK